MDSSSAVDPVAAVVAALRGRDGTRWVGVDGKGATGKTTLAAQIAAALPGRLSCTSMISPGPMSRAGSGTGSSGRCCNRCSAVGRVGISAGISTATWARSGTPSRSGCRWSLRGCRPPTYGWVFRGTSRSGSRCRTSRLARAMERDGPERLDRWLTDWMPSEDAYEEAQRPQDRVDLVYRPPYAT